MTSPVLATYRRLAGKPGGRWLFSRLVCLKAPYFASIAPRVETLEPGLGIASLRHRRRVRNHIGSVHAIALCNLAEFIGGLTTEASLPAHLRWIPKGMQVQYLRKAMGTMRARAELRIAPGPAAETGHDLPVHVDISGPDGDCVFRATISMWVSPRPGPGPATPR